MSHAQRATLESGLRTYTPPAHDNLAGMPARFATLRDELASGLPVSAPKVRP